MTNMIFIWGYFKNGDGVEVARFLSTVDETIICDAAKAIARDPTFGFDEVVVEDDNIGIIWKTCDVDESADIDSAMCFDPYNA